jgi:hypothetical protein
MWREEHFWMLVYSIKCNFQSRLGRHTCWSRCVDRPIIVRVVAHADGVRPCLSDVATNGSVVGLLGNMSVESRGGMILQRKTEELSGNPVPMLLCPPQVPYGLTRARTGLLSHGTAKDYCYLILSSICRFYV